MRDKIFITDISQAICTQFPTFTQYQKVHIMETIRQKQVGKIIQVALSDVFIREAREILGTAMVSVTQVKITPDLLQAKVYLSIYNTQQPEEILGFIRHNDRELRHILGSKIRNKVRRIPELIFFRDDTMDEVIKLETLLHDIKEKDEAIEEIRKNSDFKDENPYKDETLNS
jgi:ribosome-binding factor A